MIVAGCVATSFVLAVAGIVALASLVKPTPADAEPVIKSSNSVVFQQAAEPAKLILAKAAPFTDRLPGWRRRPRASLPIQARLRHRRSTPRRN